MNEQNKHNNYPVLPQEVFFSQLAAVLKEILHISEETWEIYITCKDDENDYGEPIKGGALFVSHGLGDNPGKWRLFKKYDAAKEIISNCIDIWDTQDTDPFLDEWREYRDASFIPTSPPPAAPAEAQLPEIEISDEFWQKVLDGRKTRTHRRKLPEGIGAARQVAMGQRINLRHAITGEKVAVVVQDIEYTTIKYGKIIVNAEQLNVATRYDWATSCGFPTVTEALEYYKQYYQPDEEGRIKLCAVVWKREGVA